MGKTQQQQQYLQPNEHHHQQNQQQNELHPRDSSRTFLFCEGSSTGLDRFFGQQLSLKCIAVLLLGFAVSLSSIFWILPLHSVNSGFDANAAVKLSATVQASFRLKKPVGELVMNIGRLEYDIYGEIGVPDTKVAVLSLHQSGFPNFTDVVFGVLSDPMDTPINQMFRSVLRSYLVDLFLQQSNLTLTASLFGQPSEFQILKFPGGITVNPEPSASIWQMPETFFKFCLYNSINEIKENFVEFQQQLKYGLSLRSYEEVDDLSFCPFLWQNVYVQVRNADGSTLAPFVLIEASVMSDSGSLLPQRLKQLAQTISVSPAHNLGLDTSVFGRVKGVSLSSYLKGTLNGPPPLPTPAPAPSPFIGREPSPSSSHQASHSYSPAPSTDVHHHPCHDCGASPPSTEPHAGPERKPHYSLPPIASSPAPSVISIQPPKPCPFSGAVMPPVSSPSHCSSTPTPSLPPAFASHSPPMVPAGELSPSIAPMPRKSFGLAPKHHNGNFEGLVSPASPSTTSLAVPPSQMEIAVLALGAFFIHLLS